MNEPRQLTAFVLRRSFLLFLPWSIVYFPLVVNLLISPRSPLLFVSSVFRHETQTFLVSSYFRRLDIVGDDHLRSGLETSWESRGGEYEELQVNRADKHVLQY